MKRKSKDYTPINGFYDLRDYDIPEREFVKLWRMQEYLSTCERNRREGKYKDMPHELKKVKELSAKYQQALFSYRFKNTLNFAV